MSPETYSGDDILANPYAHRYAHTDKDGDLWLYSEPNKEWGCLYMTNSENGNPVYSLHRDATLHRYGPYTRLSADATLVLRDFVRIRSLDI